MKKSVVALLATASLAGLSALSMQAIAQEEKPAAAEAKTDAKPAETKPEAEAAPAAEAKPAKEYTILRLNGEEIKSSEPEEVWKGLFPGGTAPDFGSFDEKVRQNVLKSMVSERLIYQEAVKEGFDKSEEAQKRLESLKKQLIMQSYIESKAKKLVTDQQLKTAYAEHTAQMKNQEEIRARHILVADENEAKALVKELRKGGDFEKLAKDKSVDKGSGAQGGDLGYFTKDKMVPEFAEAAFKLKKGEISDPVKSSFGWHVIKVEDRRPVKVPTFEEMREELQAEVSNKAVQEYVEGLLKKADIKYYGPDGKERDFPRNIDVPKE